MHWPTPDMGFDPKRVLLGDVDGDGVADLVYVESGRVTIWLNQSGNGWSDPIVIQGTPPISDIDAVRLVDVSVAVQLESSGPMISKVSPIALTSSWISLAKRSRTCLTKETTTAALARWWSMLPRRASTTKTSVNQLSRWQTRLPFPMQVVARVEAIDELSGGKLTTRIPLSPRLLGWRGARVPRFRHG